MQYTDLNEANKGRPQRYGEPTGVTSVRLPKSDLKQLDKMRHNGFDVSGCLHNVINRYKR